MEQQPRAGTLGSYYDGCPIGTVLAYAGEWPGNLDTYGWLLCDGKPLAASTYPDLYNAIKNLYGGDAVNFNLPDLQGYFIRGVNTTQSGKDPNRKVGTKQDDAFKKHKHTWKGFHYTTRSLIGNHSRAEEWIDSDPENDCTNDVGDVETRPLNIAMNYIIKAKNIM